ncbi:hypothetical protein [Clostridium transplantifaecale]|uniref:hypothetical protein n=1 Tax=Clostridium transplantifaecale TaxID=2479838 RepID=UPI001FA9CAA7|nr:hypothetical protein [Clostridium transplantifaecale]
MKNQVNKKAGRIKNTRIKTGILCLEASLTVEAALVMSAMFLFIASLLTGVFEIHARVTGNMVLQEALERYVHLEEEEEGQTARELEIRAQQDYRGYFWCSGGRIALREAGNRLEGEAGGKTETSISVKKFDPENFLRLLRAAGV